MNDPKPPSIFQVIKSVLAAFIGVQSDANRHRDFTQGNPAHYIIAGFIMTLVFILVIWGIVKLVLKSAGV